MVKQFPPSFNQNRLAVVEWRNDETLSFAANKKGDTKIWEQPLNGEANILLDLPHTSVFRFSWSKDGKKLILETGETLNNAILINSVN